MAATVTWINSAGGNWDVGGNWHPDHPPGQGHDDNESGLINAPGAYTVTYDVTGFDIEDLTIGATGTAAAHPTLNFLTNETLSVGTLTALVAGTIDVLQSGARFDSRSLDLDAGTVLDVGNNAIVAVGSTIANAGLIESTSGAGNVLGDADGTSTITGVGTVEVSGSTLNLDSNVIGDTQSFQVSTGGGILTMAGSVADDNTFIFDGTTGQFRFQTPVADGVTETQNVVGMTVGLAVTAPSATDSVRLVGDYTVDGTNERTGAGDTTVTLTNTDGGTFTLDLSGIDGAASGTWFVNADEVGSNTSVFLSTVCFAAGTHIRTPTGDKLVESLTPGDIVFTFADGQLSPQPVKWLGRRRIDLTKYSQPEKVAPVRIQRGAFAENEPHSDLLLSPDHAIFVDGKLICARQLINGATIWQEKDLPSIEYYHVELDTHAILLAEGLPTESYLNTGNQGFFANSSEPLVLHPDLTDETDYPTREAGCCAPFVWDEASVRPVWQRLTDRAAAIGQPVPQLATTTEANLRVRGRDRRARNHGKPLYADSNLVLFVLPRGEKEFRLISRAQSPAEARPWLEDRRKLGVRVNRIVLRGADELHEIPLDHPDLTKGWWAVERDGQAMSRWTNGDAVLPLPERVSGEVILEIHLAGAMTYVVEAERVAA